LRTTSSATPWALKIVTAPRGTSSSASTKSTPRLDKSSTT
jgi:hypothetical protein